MSNTPQPGFLVAIWFALVAFLSSFFRRSAASSPPTTLPSPATARPVLRSPPSPFPVISLSALFATPPTQPDRSPPTLADRPDPPSDIPPLPSPWSPVGKTTAQDVWMSAHGMLTNATGPLNQRPRSPSTTSLYSSTSALDAFGISVFVNLGTVGDALSNQASDTTQVRNPPPLLTTHAPRTPRKRRETIPSVNKPAPSTHPSRAAKCLSTPLTKIENVDVSHLRSASSFSSMAYEFRMGLIADGRSMTAIDNIISLLDQDSPEHTQPFDIPIQPLQVV